MKGVVEERGDDPRSPVSVVYNNILIIMKDSQYNYTIFI